MNPIVALPNAQDIATIFAAFYRESRDVGYGVMLVALTLAFIREFLFGMQERSNYASLFVRILVISGLYAIYTPFFEEVTKGMELLANFFMPEEQFKQQIQLIFTAYQDNHNLVGWAIWKLNLMELFMQGTYMIAYAILRAYGWVRVLFLSALYISGPIFLGVGMFRPGMARMWVRWLFEILLWNVVMSLFVRVLFEINFFEFYTRLGVFNPDLFAMNLIVVYIILFSTMRISSMIIRETEGFTEHGSNIIGRIGVLAQTPLRIAAAPLRKWFS